MISFPNAKINIGLNIVKKRGDGFHDIESIFYPVALHDVLEVIVLPAKQQEVRTTTEHYDITFSSSGIPIPGEGNLCEKAFHLLQKKFPDKINSRKTQIHLHKLIPIGAGLGGGSADAAFALQIFNKMFELNLETNNLKDLASELGSDCAFFIDNTPSIATGRGNVLERINLDLSGFFLFLVMPEIHISTADAYSEIIPALPEKHLGDLILQDIHTWKDVIKNDFEVPVFRKYPELKNMKEKLYDLGAVYASLSGSGSTIYGIFDKKIERNNLFPNCITKSIKLKLSV